MTLRELKLYSLTDMKTNLKESGKYLSWKSLVDIRHHEVHTRTEEKVMVTGGDEGIQTRTLLYFNFVEKRKFDEEQDENDQGSDWLKMCFVVCGAYHYSFGNYGNSKSFWHTWSFRVTRMPWNSVSFKYSNVVFLDVQLNTDKMFHVTTCHWDTAVTVSKHYMS